MTIVLGIDTATTGCAAAVLGDGACLAMANARMARGQSETLMPMIDGVIRDAGIGMADIDAVAVTRGPGAFTGLRIGLAAARALALALSKPCLGIGTFDALLLQAQDAGAFDGVEALVCVIDSKREDLFVAVYDDQGAPLAVPQAMRASEIPDAVGPRRRIAVIGDAAEAAVPSFGADFTVRHFPDIDLPDPRAVARLGLAALDAPDDAPATPLYLRPPDVTLPKP